MDKKIPIYIGFSKPKDHKLPILSWLIRAFEGFIGYSHSYIRWYSSKIGLNLCYHASGTQVHFLGSKLFDKKINIVHEYRTYISEEAYTELLRFCIKNAGVKYGVKQLLGIVWVRVNKLLGKRVKNPYADGDKSRICTEVVGHIIRDVLHHELSEDLDKYLESAGLKELKKLLDQSNSFEKIR